MSRFVRRRLLLPVVLLVLAACGVSATTGAGGSCANLHLDASPGTQSAGPVSVATDHTTYSRRPEIHVTLTNTLSTSIFAPNHFANCTIFDLQQLVKGKWQPPKEPLAHCALASPTVMIEIKPGTTYTATIKIGSPRAPGFEAGTYRLAFSYSSTRTPTDAQGTAVNSQNLTIADCGALPVQTQTVTHGTPRLKTPIPVTPVLGTAEPSQ